MYARASNSPETFPSYGISDIDGDFGAEDFYAGEPVSPPHLKGPNVVPYTYLFLLLALAVGWGFASDSATRQQWTSTFEQLASAANNAAHSSLSPDPMASKELASSEKPAAPPPAAPPPATSPLPLPVVTVTEAPGSKPEFFVGGHRKRRCRCAITVFAVRSGRPVSQTGGSRRASSRFVTRAPRAALGDGLSQRCVCYRESGQDRSGRWRIYVAALAQNRRCRLQRPLRTGRRTRLPPLRRNGHQGSLVDDRAADGKMRCEGRLSQPCEGKDDRIVEITRARHGPWRPNATRSFLRNDLSLALSPAFPLFGPSYAA